MEPQTQFTPRERDPAAPTFLMGYDSTPIQAEKSLYDLAEWAKGKAELAAWIIETPTDEIARSLLEGKALWQKVEGWDEFASRFRAYLRQYGHIIYELDFGKLITTGAFILCVALLSPALNALISAHVTAKQGIMMGLNSSFMSLGRVVGPI
ncbi:MAG TPA: hypothetical protein VJL59_19610 [Anaerolineales bacterium]|nr:hypothetical protein [Anaerolineales bacterium]